ncbi:hypothetical protein MAR_037578 [Mya arenaria]|uniref:Uncharacterized protein n=1 Tax=Mya arenaria TaxID=6604 RepID=A0ABY7FRI2_MYAAR|nr:uncharacterized protein LOC128214001 [Mya arenaria]WAR23909.1 hypothetical protein MAR_037578 [Mya arenaria]
MGCKQSKAVRVQPVGPAEANKGKLRSTESDAGIECDVGDKRRRRGKRSNSRDSLDDDVHSENSDRGGSATSKKSNDSGVDDLGEYNHAFITEHSDANKVREIESQFKERDDLDLGITGTALNTRNSAKDKARLEESMVLQKLREEGLISKPSTEKSGGVSFEIVDMSSSMGGGGKLPALPPLRLAKLEKRRKKKRPLTDEEIKQKLERAEERRKRKEQARLEKIKELDKTDHTAALTSFADYQKKKEETVVRKMESAQDNKERRMREIKEKQLERERKREEVRQRRKERMEIEAMQAANGEIVKDTSELMNERLETPVVPE